MIKRSISMPVKPECIEATPRLERSEEKEELFTEDELLESKKPFLKNFTIASDAKSDEMSPDRRDKIKWIWKDDSDEQKNEISHISYKPEKEQKIATRVINKGGGENVTFSRIPQRSLQYCKDFVTTLVEQDWKYTFTMFLLSFFVSWIIFTALWYIIAYAHGDFFFDETTGARLGEGSEPCVVGATSLVGLFIYTVETQVTIGFGEKYPSEECPESVFLFVFQIIVSVAIEGTMIGIIYAKMAKPVKQISKLKFSKTAVIYRRDGKLCFCFRVCDPREQQSIGTKVRIYIMEEKRTAEGEFLKVHRELAVIGNTSPILIWPETICHIIDTSSPLYKYSSNRFNGKKDFEIIVSLVGASPTTGQLTESRTSYLPGEILWNQRFLNVIQYDWTKRTYLIDYSNFNSTVSAEDEQVAITQPENDYDFS